MRYRLIHHLVQELPREEPGNDHQMSVQSLKYWYSSGLVRKKLCLRVGRAKSVNSYIQLDAGNTKFNHKVFLS